MIEPYWYRIAGIHVTEAGEIAAVWLAWDRDNDTVHVTDACVFRREVLAVVCEGINARGRFIPVAWEKNAKALAGELLSRGCNMTVDPADDNDAMAEVISRTIWERMRSSRFRVNRRLGEWLDEFKSFQRQDNKIPRDTHPLMAATRHAMQRMDDATRQEQRRGAGALYPKLAIV